MSSYHCYYICTEYMPYVKHFFNKISFYIVFLESSNVLDEMKKCKHISSVI